MASFFEPFALSVSVISTPFPADTVRTCPTVATSLALVPSATFTIRRNKSVSTIVVAKPVPVVLRRTRASPALYPTETTLSSFAIDSEPNATDLSPVAYATVPKAEVF